MAQKSTQKSLNIAQEKGPEALTEKQAKHALGEAIGKVTRLTKLNAVTTEQLVVTGHALIETGEFHGSNFLASMAEGYHGPEKLKLGGVDMRAVAGGLAMGLGFYGHMTGHKGAGHALSVGNGIMASFVASAGKQAGRAIGERRAAPAAPGAAPAPSGFHGPLYYPTLETAGLYPSPGMEGVRERMLTEEVSGPRAMVGPAHPSTEGPSRENRVARRGQRRERAKEHFSRVPRASDEDSDN